MVIESIVNMRACCPSGKNLLLGGKPEPPRMQSQALYNLEGER